MSRPKTDEELEAELMGGVIPVVMTKKKIEEDKRLAEAKRMRARAFAAAAVPSPVDPSASAPKLFSGSSAASCAAPPSMQKQPKTKLAIPREGRTKRDEDYRRIAQELEAEDEAEREKVYAQLKRKIASGTLGTTSSATKKPKPTVDPEVVKPLSSDSSQKSLYNTGFKRKVLDAVAAVDHTDPQKKAKGSKSGAAAATVKKADTIQVIQSTPSINADGTTNQSLRLVRMEIYQYTAEDLKAIAESVSLDFMPASARTTQEKLDKERASNPRNLPRRKVWRLKPLTTEEIPIYKNVSQKDPKWKGYRGGQVGASSVGIYSGFGYHGNLTQSQYDRGLKAPVRHRLEECYLMDRGHCWEPEIRRQCELVTRCDIDEWGIIINPDYVRVHASIDGHGKYNPGIVLHKFLVGLSKHFLAEFKAPFYGCYISDDVGEGGAICWSKLEYMCQKQTQLFCVQKEIEWEHPDHTWFVSHWKFDEKRLPIYDWETGRFLISCTAYSVWWRNDEFASLLNANVEYHYECCQRDEEPMEMKPKQQMKKFPAVKSLSYCMVKVWIVPRMNEKTGRYIYGTPDKDSLPTPERTATGLLGTRVCDDIGRFDDAVPEWLTMKEIALGHRIKAKEIPENEWTQPLLSDDDDEDNE